MVKGTDLKDYCRPEVKLIELEVEVFCDSPVDEEDNRGTVPGMPWED